MYPSIQLSYGGNSHSGSSAVPANGFSKPKRASFSDTFGLNKKKVGFEAIVDLKTSHVFFEGSQNGFSCLLRGISKHPGFSIFQYFNFPTAVFRLLSQFPPPLQLVASGGRNGVGTAPIGRKHCGRDLVDAEHGYSSRFCFGVTERNVCFGIPKGVDMTFTLSGILKGDYPFRSHFGSSHFGSSHLAHYCCVVRVLRITHHRFYLAPIVAPIQWRR